jgi:chloride channel protein, CIC family
MTHTGSVPPPREWLPPLLAAAVAAGLLAGFAVLLFEQMVHGAEWLAHGWQAERWSDAHRLLVVLVPITGGLLVGVILQLSGVPEEPGHGVTEVIEAAAADHIEFPHHKVPVKAAVAAISLGAGASLGPEDPAVEIGGGIGEAVGRARRLSHDAVRNLVAAGAAAGVGATFVSPAAALAFAVEVLHVRAFSRSALLVAAAVVAAWAPARVFSPAPPFHVPQHDLPLAGGLLIGSGIGLLCGAVSAGQVKLMYWTEHRVLHWSTPPRWLKPAVGGAILAAGGLLMPSLLGVGYETLESVLAAETTAVRLLVALAVGKVVLVAISFGTGFLGGVFAPAFFTGAALGAAVGATLAPVLPDQAAGIGGLAVVGMAAMVSGVVHAPLTAVLAARAIVGGYALLPVLIPACLLSYGVARLLHPFSAYTHQVDEDLRGREHD